MHAIRRNSNGFAMCPFQLQTYSKELLYSFVFILKKMLYLKCSSFIYSKTFLSWTLDYINSDMFSLHGFCIVLCYPINTVFIVVDEGLYNVDGIAVFPKIILITDGQPTDTHLSTGPDNICLESEAMVLWLYMTYIRL